MGVLQIRLPDELLARVRAKRGNVSEAVRGFLAQWVGMPEDAATVEKGKAPAIRRQYREPEPEAQSAPWFESCICDPGQRMMKQKVRGCPARHPWE